MKQPSDLSDFKGAIAQTTMEKNQLVISDEFTQQFSLYSFLVEYVLGPSFENEHGGQTINITNNETLLQIIVKHLKAKQYIGVGVGGLCISNKITKEPIEYALLYKRYHAPEDQVWSILGGSGEFHEKIEDTLKRKISRITKISKDAIVVKDIIRANNHDEIDYHFLSPAFYVEITTLRAHLYWGDGITPEKKKKVSIINNLSDFSQLGHSTHENPLLAWVDVRLIDGQSVDTNGNQLFSFTTLQAIERHRHIRDATKRIVSATEAVKSYMDWRISKT